MMADERHIKGLAELNKFLTQLPPKLERNVMRGALRAGAKKELLPETKRNLQRAGAVKTGKLRDGLKITTRARGGKITASVVSAGPHAFIAKWIEYGVKAHNIAAKQGGWLSFLGIFRKEIAHPGFAARPFLRPALDVRGDAAVNEVARYTRQRLATKHGLDTSGVMLEGDE